MNLVSRPGVVVCFIAERRREGPVYLKRNVLVADFFRASSSFARNLGTSLLARTGTVTSEAFLPKTLANVVAVALANLIFVGMGIPFFTRK